MNRIIAGFLTLALIGLVLFILAASYEITSLKSALTKMVKHFRGASVLSLPSVANPDKTVVTPRKDEPRDFQEVIYRNVSFSITEENLNRMLFRRRVLLKGSLLRERKVSSQLSDGNMVLNSTNTFHLFGVKVLQYAGFSDWSIAVQGTEFGVKLNDLRVMGVPFPFSSRVFSELSDGTPDGWVYLKIPSEQIVEKVEISDGKLMVSGKIR